MPTHAFWSTQPVPTTPSELDSVPLEEQGPIATPSAEHDANGRPRSEAYGLPASFTWSTLDLDEPAQLEELHALLSEHYIDSKPDGNGVHFAFQYTAPFLKWALTPPGYKADWHVGVRVVSTGKLVAFISAIPGELWCHGKRVGAQPSPDSPAEAAGGGAMPSFLADMAAALDGEAGKAAAATTAAVAAGSSAGECALDSVAEVNFLCIHLKLRSKRLAPVLIKEVTRRINLCGIFQALYTASDELPSPVACTSYYFRPLDVKKCIECTWAVMPPTPRMKLDSFAKLHKLPAEPTHSDWRPLAEADCEHCCARLNAALAQLALAPRMGLAEFKHWLLPKPGVVYTYVNVPPGGLPTAMVSYYSLPSGIHGVAKHSQLFPAYCFYHFSDAADLPAIFHDMLVLARNDGFESFHATDVMGHDAAFRALGRFQTTAGYLHHYLFNWKTLRVEPGQVGFIAL